MLTLTRPFAKTPSYVCPLIRGIYSKTGRFALSKTSTKLFTPIFLNKTISRTLHRKNSYKSIKNKTFSKDFLGLTAGLITGVASIYLIQQYGQLSPQKEELKLDEKKLPRNELKDLLKEAEIMGIDDKSEEIIPYIPKKDLYNLAGNEQAMDSIADLIRYLQDPEGFLKSGIKAPKGVILSGPPGVGKTALAEAVAGHAGVNFILISGSEFEMPYYGQAEAKMRKLFKQAANMAPCIICIDEIDSVATARFTQGEGSQHANRLLNQLLTLLSNDHPGVLVIVTTNHSDKLDSAFKRPGRFDREIFLALPDRTEREKILEIYTKGKALDKGISLKMLAAISGGFSGAQLEAWVNEAALRAHREKSEVINLKHFDKARSILTMGIARNNTSDPKVKFRQAAHEAGHAMVGHLLNRSLYKITIHPYGDKNGGVEWIQEENYSNLTKQEVLDLICVSLAGRAAELNIEMPQLGSESDLDLAKQLVLHIVEKEAMGSTLLGRSSDIEKILEEQMDRACTLLKENQKALENVRDALLELNELYQEDFLRIINDETLSKNSEGWWSWLWSKNTETQSESKSKKIDLPPTAKKIVTAPETQSAKTKKDEKKDKFPFTPEEVAKKIGVDPSRIRHIKKGLFGGWEIVFKPSFDQREHMEEISEKLKQKDIENIYLHNQFDKQLNIYSEGMEDFIRFLKE